MPHTPNGFSVSHEWWGGRINGADRHVVYATPGTTVTLRVVNAGDATPYRLTVDEHKMVGWRATRHNGVRFVSYMYSDATMCLDANFRRRNFVLLLSACTFSRMPF
jgi:hypothetical protein